PLSSWAQDSSGTFDKIVNFPQRFFTKVNAKTASLDQSLTRQTEKFLQRLSRKEAKLKKKLARIDSNAVKDLFAADPEKQYALLLQKLKTGSGATAGELSGE